MKVHTLLTKLEEAMMEELTKMGYRPSEIVRAGIRMFYRKEKPHYVKIKEQGDESPLDKLSNEQYCVDVKGGVVEGQFCVIRKPNGMEEKIPLNIIKED